LCSDGTSQTLVVITIARGANIEKAQETALLHHPQETSHGLRFARPGDNKREDLPCAKPARLALLALIRILALGRHCPAARRANRVLRDDPVVRWSRPARKPPAGKRRGESVIHTLRAGTVLRRPSRPMRPTATITAYKLEDLDELVLPVRPLRDCA